MLDSDHSRCYSELCSHVAVALDKGTLWTVDRKPEDYYSWVASWLVASLLADADAAVVVEAEIVPRFERVHCFDDAAE